MGGLEQDFRYALRGLRNNPGFTAMVLLILALAVGASTAVFSVVDAIVLRALPFDEHDRLVAIGERRSGMPGPGIGSIAPQNFLDWREQQEVFEALAGFATGSFTLQEPGREPEELRVMRVSSEFFDVLRTPPMLGRGFLPENEIDGRHRVAVISYGFWQSRFGGAPDAVGKSIPLEGASYQIAGVAPIDFSYPVSAEKPTQIWVPLVVPADERIRNPGRFSSYLQGIARLKAGVSLDRAAAQMNQIALALETEHPEWNKDRRIGVRPLYDHIVGDSTRSWMLMLLGAVALVLLIACANIANLMLARASTRTQEMSVRAAIGASRWRIARQFLIDGLILSLAGTAAGVLLAGWGVQILRGAMPETIPQSGIDCARSSGPRRRGRGSGDHGPRLRDLSGPAVLARQSGRPAEGWRPGRIGGPRPETRPQRPRGPRDRARGGAARRSGTLHRQLCPADGCRSGLRSPASPDRPGLRARSARRPRSWRRRRSSTS